ncbi:MAG: cytochrome c biogenesis protein CcdA [Gemmatimonadales bacterium]|nr:cytochrome c biogenesis protein CcdA [Gemmatimonadales bacterium]
MQEPATLGLTVAFLAGVLSFLSPCVLPLVPSYIGFLTGMTLEEATTRRRNAFLHALLFVLGFALVFIVLGATATALGRALKFYQVWLARLGGLLIIGFGLWSLGVFRVDALMQERRVHVQEKPVGMLGSVLVGMAFGAGWTPCIGPVLGAILGLAATSGDVQRGVLLLAVYSLGLAVPFLLAAAAVDRFLAWFAAFRRHLPLVQKASGVLLILVGALLVSGQFTRLAGWLQGLTPEFLRSRI